MMQLALERVDTLNVGILQRLIEPIAVIKTSATSSIFSNASVSVPALRSVRRTRALAAGGVVLGADDFVIELDVLPGVVLPRDLLEVLLDLVAQGVEGRPVALRG